MQLPGSNCLAISTSCTTCYLRDLKQASALTSLHLRLLKCKEEQYYLPQSAVDGTKGDNAHTTFRKTLNMYKHSVNISNIRILIKWHKRWVSFCLLLADTQDGPRHDYRSYLAGGNRLTSPLGKVKHRRLGLQDPEARDGVVVWPLSASSSPWQMASFTKSLALSFSSFPLTRSQAAKLLTSAPYFCSERRLTRMDGQRSPNCML